MLIDQDAVLRASEHVDDTMFYDERHRRIFRAMIAITERSEVVDPVTLGDELNRRGGFQLAPLNHRIAGFTRLGVLGRHFRLELGNGFAQVQQDALHIAYDRDVGYTILAYLGGVDVDVDHTGMRRKGSEATGNAIVD